MERNLRKQREGIVTSNKMDKTITVEVQRRVKHPIYGKFVKKSSKLTAHDEQNQCDIGDLVRVMETRPISKNKSCLLYTSPSPRDGLLSRMPSSA